MKASLERLYRDVVITLDGDPARRPLGGVGVFHCRSPQSIHDVPIDMPLMVLVVSGRKRIVLGGREVLVHPGELLLVPADSRIEVGNHPDSSGRAYLGLALGFPEEAVAQFRRLRGAEMVETSARWCAAAPEPLVGAMEQWVDWCRRFSPDPVILQQRRVEFLLILARAGLAGNMLAVHSPGWRRRVAQLVFLDPAHPWQAAEVGARLGVGESTLRRHLGVEGTGFRQVLEETRLTAGLSLLQETFWPIGQVAAAVGYQSPSRFAERFRERFGLSPSELRATRVQSDAGGAAPFRQAAPAP